MGKYLVTQAQWEEVMGNFPKEGNGKSGVKTISVREQFIC